MYVAKFDRSGMFWRVTVFEKSWSDKVLSHEIKELKTKNFVFYGRGYRWAEKQICQSLFYKKRLEIING